MSSRLQKLVQDVSIYLNVVNIEAALVEQIFRKCITLVDCITDIMNSNTVPFPSEYPYMIGSAMASINTILFIHLRFMSIDPIIHLEIENISTVFGDAFAAINAAIVQYNIMMQNQDNYMKYQIVYQRTFLTFQENINRVRNQLLG